MHSVQDSKPIIQVDDEPRMLKKRFFPSKDWPPEERFNDSVTITDFFLCSLELKLSFVPATMHLCCAGCVYSFCTFYKIQYGFLLPSPVCRFF